VAESIGCGSEFVGQAGDGPGRMMGQTPGQQHDREWQEPAQPHDLADRVVVGDGEGGAMGQRGEQLRSRVGFEDIQRQRYYVVEGDQSSMRSPAIK
jgi:hypothetical protein